MGEPLDRRGLVVRQAVDDLDDRAVDVPVRPGQFHHRALGGLHDDPPAVLRVGLSFGAAVADEPVHELRDRRGRQAQQPGELGGVEGTALPPCVRELLQCERIARPQLQGLECLLVGFVHGVAEFLEALEGSRTRFRTRAAGEQPRPSGRLLTVCHAGLLQETVMMAPRAGRTN
ncbi:hypothetical protein J7E22_05805 [Curtobacterium sp. ISL-83]|nr:hypothetical protein [Curtobacterium sp. ISL-83]MBT2502052.1 hypothetical protein [Curtobacterium sp. ISL-83]